MIEAGTMAWDRVRDSDALGLSVYAECEDYVEHLHRAEETRHGQDHEEHDHQEEEEVAEQCGSGSS